MQTWKNLHNNPELFQRYFVKEYLIKAVRKFFERRNFHELESPILASALPQERYLDPLETQIELQNGKKHTAYLIPTTETYNKKILVAGLGNHFVITKVFRALEEISPNHSPEFTMLEWYELGKTYKDMMKSTERLLYFCKKYIDQKLKRKFSSIVNYQGLKIDFTPPWYRFSVSELFKKYLNIELLDVLELDKFREVAMSKGYNVDKNDDWQTIFELLFSSEVEPNLPTDKPFFIYDYPKILCPLTKENEKNPNVCEKVELYIAGKELGNIYTELRDSKEQEKRFHEEQAARKSMKRKPVKFDSELVEALAVGMPPVSGIGVGLDRVAMILADAKDISEINYFPASEIFSNN